MMAFATLLANVVGIVIIAFLILALIVEIRRRRSCFPTIPGPPALPFVGNLLQMTLYSHTGTFCDTMQQKYGNVWKMELCSKEMIMLCDPENIAKASKSTTRFFKLTSVGDEPMVRKYGMLSPVLFDLQGEIWKFRRHYVQKAFDQKHTRALFDITNKLANKFVDRLIRVYATEETNKNNSNNDDGQQQDEDSFWDKVFEGKNVPILVSLLCDKKRRSRKEAKRMTRGVKAFDIMPEMRRVMFEIMGHTILGVEFGLLDEKEDDDKKKKKTKLSKKDDVLCDGVELADAFEYAVYKMTWDSVLPSWWVGGEKKLKKYVDFITETISKRIEECEKLSDEELTQHGSILAMLILAGRGEAAIKLSKEDVISELFQYCVAGFDTSKVTLGVLFHHLSQHLPAQRRLRAEVGEGLSSVEDLNSCAYLTSCMKESQRLQPVAALLDRIAEEDFEITLPRSQSLSSSSSSSPPSTLRVPKGSVVCMQVASVQKNPDEWGEDAADFKPERFMGESSSASQTHRMAFMPFGGGPKLCVGFQLAQMQVRTVAAAIVSRLEVFPVRGYEELKMFDSVILTPKEVRVSLRKIDDDDDDKED